MFVTLDGAIVVARAVADLADAVVFELLPLATEFVALRETVFVAARGEEEVWLTATVVVAEFLVFVAARDVLFVWFVALRFVVPTASAREIVPPESVLTIVAAFRVLNCDRDEVVGDVRVVVLAITVVASGEVDEF